jgi:hypothetical protein
VPLSRRSLILGIVITLERGLADPRFAENDSRCAATLGNVGLGCVVGPGLPNANTPQPMMEGIHRVIDAASQLDPASEIGQTAANRNPLIKAIKAELKQRLSIEPRAWRNYGRYLSIFTLNPETTKSSIGCSPANRPAPTAPSEARILMSAYGG